ncbi:hypothetical protein PMAYCL1PPCAC_07813, partial [Pristionchus mayeri]
QSSGLGKSAKQKPSQRAAGQSHSTPPPVQSSGEEKPSSKRSADPPKVTPEKTAVAASGKKKNAELPPSSSISHAAVRRGASSAKLAKSLSKAKEKKKLLLKTPKRGARSRCDSLEVFTCEDGGNNRDEEPTQITIEGNSSTGDALKVDKTAQMKDETWSLLTCEDEWDFEQEPKKHVMGNVDEIMADLIATDEDW